MSTPHRPRRLSRRLGDAGPPAPVRMVHLGVGGFSRAHQAWYTQQATDSADWGIAAFTGRRPDLADALTGQDGLYTLVTRAADGDRFEVIGSISEAHAGSDHATWLRLLASPHVELVTITVTEAGYVRGPDGHLDTHDATVAEDLHALHHDLVAPVRSAPARLAAGLLARCAAGAGPITLVPCDNLPENAAAVHRVVEDAVDLVAPQHHPWMVENVGCVTTMVDRITPAGTQVDRRLVADRTGIDDLAPVVTEPFHEWVLSGRFRAGHPDWESAGARMVPDILPFEQRKLWLLNGAHSLLAYAGSARGHLTVAEAIADPTCRAWVGQWWDEASRHLTLPADEIADYRRQLLERFANPAIRHELAQIAMDGTQKIPARILPVLRAELAAGRTPRAAARVVAAWIAHLRGHGARVRDAGADQVRPRAQGGVTDAVRAVLDWLDPALATKASLLEDVVADVAELEH